MSNVTDFLDEIERLAYKILLWVLLVPKTLIKILFEPNWVPGYVKDELKGESREAFDRFVSPVVLFLIVTLIPTLFFSYIPTVGMTVSQPQPLIEGELRDMVLTVNGTFISSTSRVFHKVWWEVWQADYKDAAGNPVYIEYGYDPNYSIIYYDENLREVQNPEFKLIYGELHDEKKGEVNRFSLSNSGERIPSKEPLYPSEITLLDNNTIEDYFYYTFPEGEFQIRLTIENYDPNTENLIETQSNTIYVTVPADATQGIYFDSPVMDNGENEVSGSRSSGFSLESLRSGLESGSIYLLALVLLSLPLLFSFGTKVLGEDGLGESSLKTSFYIQCYYFSPLTAAFWAMLYSLALYTPDIYGWAVITPLVIFALMIMWFCSAEIQAIVIERGISKGRAWGVLFILSLVLLGSLFFAFLIIIDIDILRRYSISLYPVVGVALLIAYLFRRRRERLLNKQKTVESAV